MGQQDLATLLAEQGYMVVQQIIPREYIDAVNLRTHDLVANRGHGVDNRYWPQDRVSECPELALWWSQQIADWPEVQKITEILLDLAGPLFNHSRVYVADIITNTPKNQYIKPHIDSPYRFEQWHKSFELLGVQCILPLCEFTERNGGTGLYPGSHLRNWTVKDSYRGVYNEEFFANVRQPSMQIGDALIYHPRVLHSTMPNKSTHDRRALLVHITSEEMAKQMRNIDNIFTGKPSQ